MNSRTTTIRIAMQTEEETERARKPERPPVKRVGRPPCVWRESCGCDWPMCHHASAGPAHGTVERQVMNDQSVHVVYRVDLAACTACGGKPQ